MQHTTRNNAHTKRMGLAQVRGEVHHDRRLHQLMLAEEVKAWDRQYAAAAAADAADAAAPAAGPASCAERAERAAEAPAAPEVPCFSGRGDPVPAPARRAAAAAGVELTAGATGELAAGASVMASPADSASSLHGGLLCASEDAGAMYRCGIFLLVRLRSRDSMGQSSG